MSLTHARVALVSAVIVAAPCAAQPMRYRVHILEPTETIQPGGGPPIGIFAFDNAGRGYGYRRREFNQTFPVVWEDGILSDLPGFPAGIQGQVTGVSPSGVVVGELLVGFDYGVGFIIENGNFDLLPTNAAWPVPSGVNDQGRAVGRADGVPWPGIPHQWRDGQVSALPMPDGYPTGYGNAINAGGDMVGAVAAGFDHRAVRWSGGVVSFLPTGEPANYSAATDINDSGWTVGTVQYVGSATSSAVLWRNGEVTILTAGAGVSDGSASAINSAGQIVGSAHFVGSPSTDRRGFLWQDGVLHRLDDLLEGPAPWWTFSPLAISEGGVIAGVGVLRDSGDQRGVLLIPIPGPSAIALLGFTAAVLARRQR